MCGPLNREGTLCGKCKDGYGTAFYSYTLECSQCWGHGYMDGCCTISWSNITSIHALALEYLVAFYPICLIIVTYVFIKPHDNDFMPVVWLWKPFHRHFVHFRRRWDSKASIINAFTTFLLLSFSMVLSVYVIHGWDSIINCVYNAFR